MKKISLSFLLLAVVLVFTSLTGNSGDEGCMNLHGERKSAGPPSCYAGELPQMNTCNSSGCHEDYATNSGSARLNLYLGGADWGYHNDSTYTITVSLARAGMVRGGFQIIALQDNDITTTPGLITLTDNVRTQLVDAAHPHTGPCDTQNKVWVEHTAYGIDDISGDSITWHFTWQAPSTNVGSVTFYLASVDANKDLDCTGDYVYSLSKTIQALDTTIATSINNTGNKNLAWLQISPNPLSGQAVAYYQLPSEPKDAVFVVYDLLGRLKTTSRLSTTKGSILLNANGYANGVYLCALVINGKTESVQRLVVSN
ncbi:MAG TPA: choice-of-anchor V domain-containing protein [Chitinophagales bacterium]|nr:choice-of-anchor V domain-containing protein [Chitinophagales bacterium]